MPHFVIKTDKDGTTQSILKDGQPYEGALQLEQAFSIVTIYFKLAALNLEFMAKQDSNEGRRSFGLQSFIMSLTALEAFTNTFFHMKALASDDSQLLSLLQRRHGSISRKIADLISRSPCKPLEDQEHLIERIYQLSQFRNEIVHPRWKPSELTITGGGTIKVDGLVENSQALFEDSEFCRETLFWCLLVVARIGQAFGHKDVAAFLFYWTANYGLELSYVLKELNL